jgi:PhnB protein
MAAKPIPDDYRGLIPSIVVDDAARAIEFYKRAFGATERGRMEAPDGKIAHAELEIAGSVLMLSDPLPQSSLKPPTALGGTCAAVFLYVQDVDEVFQQAIDAGAKPVLPVDDQFWGDRYGSVADPFGHQWQLATRTEDLTPEQVAERSREALASSS